jgi:hypothetical protein
MKNTPFCLSASISKSRFPPLPMAPDMMLIPKMKNSLSDTGLMQQTPLYSLALLHSLWQLLHSFVIIDSSSLQAKIKKRLWYPVFLLTGFCHVVQFMKVQPIHASDA